MGGMAWRFSDEKEGVFKKKRGSPLEVFQKERVGGGGNGLRGFPMLEGKFFSALNSWWENAPAEAAPIHSSISIFSYFLFLGISSPSEEEEKIGDRILACNLWTSFLPRRVF